MVVMRFLERETRIVLCAIGAGYGARTTLDWLGFTDYDRHPVVALVVGIVQVALILVLLVIAFTDPKRPARTGLFDMKIATTESFADFPIVTSEHAPPGQFFVINPEELRRITESELFSRAVRPVDNAHLPGCRQRHDPTAICICGRRGFQSPHRTYLRTCPNAWFSIKRCPKNDEGKHECSRSAAHLERDNACQCGCGDPMPLTKDENQ